MKKCIIVFALLLASCGGQSTPPPTDVGQPAVSISNYVYRIVDLEARTVCYVYSGGYSGGIDCMPLGETTLDEN